MKKTDPNVKEVLQLLGAGVFLAGSLIMPGLPLLMKPILNERRRSEESEWQKYNMWRLRSLLKRMHRQKMIAVVETQQGYALKITEKGKQRILQYNLETLNLSEKTWDGKWRIILYDVYESKRSFRIKFRTILKKLQFLQLQKSVYLTPFECNNEIEYLRQICNIGTEVMVLTINGLENEEVYKNYFGLK